jgi:DNA-binding NarL/FixJ family response regulator
MKPIDLPQSAVRTARAGKTSIYVLDDHPLVRRGLAELIAEEPDLVLCGEGSAASHAFNEITTLKPDVVLLDIALNGQSGLALVKRIRSFDRRIHMVILSMHDEQTYGLRALKAGALGYVVKGSPPEHVIRAIRRVRTGALWVSASLSSQIFVGIHPSITASGASPVDRLSDRELEVVDHIGRGSTTREVAARLHVSIKTVETHRTRIRNKLDLANGAQLVHFCVCWVEDNVALYPGGLTRGELPSDRSAAG